MVSWSLHDVHSLVLYFLMVETTVNTVRLIII